MNYRYFGIHRGHGVITLVLLDMVICKVKLKGRKGRKG